MPKKRRGGSLSKTSSDSKRKKNARENESDSQRISRQQANSQRMAEARENESDSQRISRQQTNSQRMAEARENESESQRLSRQQANTQRVAELRENENDEQRRSRQVANTQRMAELRENENEEQRRSRQVADNQHHAEVILQETPAQQRVRVRNNRMNQKLRQTFGNRYTHNANAKRLAEELSTPGAALRYNKDLDYSLLSDIGSMADTECRRCNAKKWKREPDGMCCPAKQRWERYPRLQEPEDPLKSLFKAETADSKEFLKNIDGYNNCFSMTSFGADKRISDTEGFNWATFKIQGQVFHQIGSLIAEPNEKPNFLQIYFISDLQEQAQRRREVIDNHPMRQNGRGLRDDIINQLQEQLLRSNHIVQQFKIARDNRPAEEFEVVIRADKVPAGEHAGRYNAPTVSEIAAVICGQEHGKRDIVIHHRTGGPPKRVSEFNHAYDGLQYPLFYSHGEDGYHFKIQLLDENGIPLNKFVTCMSYYAYLLMLRPGEFNHLHRGKDLFNKFLVDMWAKIECERLVYYRSHQKELRVDDYAHLRDALNNDTLEDTGKLVILPSNFHGGPRYMQERIQDAMTNVRTHGNPNLFITATCNPKWPEITAELLPGQSYTDRPDIVARVFRLKYKKIMDLICDYSVFGVRVGHMATVEFQKRGLPHVHILVWLKDKIQPSQIDSLISAEFPDPEEDPELFRIVKAHMVHGPCGPQNPNCPCMVEEIKNGIKKKVCSKKYPRELRKDTISDNDGFPLYRRRSREDGGQYVTVDVRRGRGESRRCACGNECVVPFNALLLRAFDAHINVEYCSSVKSIQYVCKYCNKGSDMATIGIRNVESDEITQYQNGRYICSSEAAWRTLGFPIHERYPPIERLAVHLENGERVIYRAENAREAATMPPRKTKLTAFMDLCNADQFASSLLYNEVPRYFRWDHSTREWKKRKQGKAHDSIEGYFSEDTIGRVYSVHPNFEECFYLRMLLHVVRGPKSFEDIRSVNGTVCSTYKDACKLRGMLESDDIWISTLQDASVSDSPRKLRYLLAIILHWSKPSDPAQLWQGFKESLCEDIRHQHRLQYGNSSLDFNNDIFNEALILIEDAIFRMGGQEIHMYGLPATDRARTRVPREVMRELDYDIAQMNSIVEENVPKFTQDQGAVYNAILNDIKENKGSLFFLDAPGGTGKTFLINTLLAAVRKEKQIAIATASSGIAATLLSNGRTAHSAFRLPLKLGSFDVGEKLMCNITRGSDAAEVLKKAKVIFLDEGTMLNRKALEALDNTLQDISKNNSVMGGKTFVVSGDFRQILPVIKKGTRANEVDACFKSSYLWQHVKILTLQTNMRVHLSGDQNASEFSEKLLRVGNGEVPTDENNEIDMSQIGNIVQSSEELSESVYENLATEYMNLEWLCERSILGTKNDVVDEINMNLLNKIPGEIVSYKSIDMPMDESEAFQFPVEFLNKIEMSGIPPHNLRLKVGCPIMLLRNIEPPKLCNGTRLVVKQLFPHLIEAEILTGVGKGEQVFISKIPITPTDTPVDFKRIQFPIKICFSMTVNKSQGQSLKVAGLHLDSPCFAHGQLYVACSRVGSPSNLYIFAPNGRSKNIVYQEVLSN